MTNCYELLHLWTWMDVIITPSCQRESKARWLVSSKIWLVKANSWAFSWRKDGCFKQKMAVSSKWKQIHRRNDCFHDEITLWKQGLAIGFSLKSKKCHEFTFGRKLNSLDVRIGQESPKSVMNLRLTSKKCLTIGFSLWKASSETSGLPKSVMNLHLWTSESPKCARILWQINSGLNWRANHNRNGTSYQSCLPLCRAFSLAPARSDRLLDTDGRLRHVLSRVPTRDNCANAGPDFDRSSLDCLMKRCHPGGAVPRSPHTHDSRPDSSRIWLVHHLRSDVLCGLILSILPLWLGSGSWAGVCLAIESAWSHQHMGRSLIQHGFVAVVGRYSDFVPPRSDV